MERADVMINGGGATDPGADPSASPHPAQDSAATAPEAQPPTPTLPPQELETDVGGPLPTGPTPDQVVAAEGGSLADQVRARHAAIASTEEFPVPGWELPSGEPGLIVVARTFGDRKAFNNGLSNEAFIARSTHELWFVKDNGEREKIEGGWGPGLAAIMGVNVQKAADLVSIVISKPDPANPQQRIPNVAGIGALATMIISWAGRGRKDAEDALGES